jgi:hypothetical protein
VAAGALGNRIDSCAIDAGGVQLQGNAFLQVKLPVAETDFPGNALPLACALTELIADRSIDFIAVRRNARADCSFDVSDMATEKFPHSSNGSFQQADRSPAPTEMDDGGNMPAPVVEDNGEAVRDKDADQDIALIGDDRITFDPLEMRNFRVGLVDHQDFTTVHLFNSQEQVRLQTKAPGHDSTIGFDLGLLITGAEPQIEGVERRSAAATIAGAKTGDQISLVSPGRLHELNFALLNCFHQVSFQPDLSEA